MSTTAPRRVSGGTYDRVADGVERFLAGIQAVLERQRTVVMTLGFAATLAAGVFMRFASLGRLGLNSDEAVYTGQAATLAGIEGFAQDFSIFRAHPLLYQYTVSLVYRQFGLSELSPRIVSAVFGVATLAIAYLLGKRLIGRRTGILAAALLAVMPFHVIVSRQALLESPMTFFYAASVYTLIRYFDALDDGAPMKVQLGWALATGVLAGFSFMAKEVAAILLAVAFAAMVITKHFRFSGAAVMLLSFAASVSPHLLALQLGPKSEGGGGWAQYVIWQVGRPANHPLDFYISNVGVYFGIPAALILLIGIGMAARRASMRSDLVALLAAVVVPVWFFQVWKVKGFHYPVVIAPLAAALIAFVLVEWWTSDDRDLRGFASIAAVIVVASMTWITATNGPIVDNYAKVGEAGYGGIPGGRETALWLAENAPEGSHMMGIGPSIGNIIRWYSDHQAAAISISPNPLRANPAYQPVRNPDYLLRWGLIEYLVYDAYSAARTPHFANRLLDFVERYGGDIVHEEYAPLVGEDGRQYMAAVVRVYRVGPVGIDLEPIAGEEPGS